MLGNDGVAGKLGMLVKSERLRFSEALDFGDAHFSMAQDPRFYSTVENLTLEKALVKENGGYNVADSYINMNFNRIRNIAPPKHNEDAVPRSFVDGEILAVEEKIKKRTHIIAASASYHGDLIKDDYQFNWGGQSMASYKKYDMFSGFLIPSSGYIRKFTVLDTGLNLNLPVNKEILDFIVYDIGYNKPIALFTLVLIRHLKEPVDIGTLYFYFTDYYKDDATATEHTFKFNPNYEEEDLRTVESKDIINIRSEFNTIRLSENVYTASNRNYPVDNKLNDFFTYLATVLIELDPLENNEFD